MSFQPGVLPSTLMMRRRHLHKRYVGECGVPVTSVTTVTKIQRYSSSALADRHRRSRSCVVPTTRPDSLPKSGDRGDDGDPDASYCRTSLKEAHPSLEMRDDIGHEHRQRKCVNVR